MLRIFKKFAWAGLALGAAHGAFGFSLLGPLNEAYQVNDLGYNPLPRDNLLTGPKNLGEGYRHNTPVMYYAFDANFLDYFGSNGVFAVDQAFTLFNSISNVSTYSKSLSEVPIDTSRHNFAAEALSMLDLKSITMNLIIENLGLASPDRYVWNIHDRFLAPGTTCPFGEEYMIIKRNFDPAIGSSPSQSKYSSYVNGTLYTYEIVEFCTAPFPPVSEAVEFPVDPHAPTFTAIASGLAFGQQFVVTPYGLWYGGLTLDDIGGLRYLYDTNNMIIESAGPNTQTLVTNNTSQLLTTSNLTLFAQQALTNNQPTLQALYPDLVILSVTNTFTNVPVQTISAFFTNFPYDPAGSPAHLVIVTNTTLTVQTLFHYTFGNLFTIQFRTNGFVAVQTPDISFSTNRSITSLQFLSATNSPYATAGSPLVTNITTRTTVTNQVSGEFFIVPTNFCEVAIIAPQLTNTVITTNVLVVSTNIFAASNVNNQVFIESRIDYSTNHTFVIFPISCVASNVALNQGIQKVSYIKRDFDSLLNRFFIPITNEYVLNSVTNNTVVPLHVRRVVTTPDILLSAESEALTPGPAVIPQLSDVDRTQPRFNTNFINNPIGGNLAGPGTIETSADGVNPGTVFNYNKIGPISLNFGLINTNAFLQETNALPLFIWGSFDGTTNAPIVYPTDISIQNLEDLVFIQITPAYLPDGSVNSSYNAQLQTKPTPLWMAPFTWSISPNFPGLPPGLSIDADPNDSTIGVISGTPSQAGFFDFVVTITDAQGRTTQRGYAIRINP